MNGRLLTAIRLLVGISINDLAQMLGLSHGAIRAYEASPNLPVTLQVHSGEISLHHDGEGWPNGLRFVMFRKTV